MVDRWLKMYVGLTEEMYFNFRYLILDLESNANQLKES